ncbi:MAG: hypothetical protein ACRC67_00085 [Inquilinus sp.]|uniref:hypothetical protein n=1 Tax=Inquilinus sp. TaxID=1932117 RepID=UPI003F367C19
MIARHIFEAAAAQEIKDFATALGAKVTSVPQGTVNTELRIETAFQSVADQIGTFAKMRTDRPLDWREYGW